jgi:hypothetical protein
MSTEELVLTPNPLASTETLNAVAESEFDGKIKEIGDKINTLVDRASILSSSEPVIKAIVSTGQLRRTEGTSFLKHNRRPSLDSITNLVSPHEQVMTVTVVPAVQRSEYMVENENEDDDIKSNCCCLFKVENNCETIKDRQIHSLKKKIQSSEKEKDENYKQIDKYKTKLKSKIEDINKLIRLELNETTSKLNKEEMKIRKERKITIEKLLSELDKFPNKMIDLQTRNEIERYIDDLQNEQKDRLKNNIALTEDIHVENDIMLVDSSIDGSTSKYLEPDKNQVISNSLDILAIFLKSEKILYTEAKSYCEQQLNFLMMPAIFISALTTVLTMAFAGTTYGNIVIASLTAINSFILAIISYLKLDAKSEAHKTSAYQFDKLQGKCEFGSGRVIFFNRHKKETKEPILKTTEIIKPVINEDNNDFQVVYDLVDMIELKVSEIKDMNKFILPEYIRTKYCNLYTTNIFSAVKAYITSEHHLRYELDKAIQALKYLRNPIIEINKKPETPEDRLKDSTDIYTWNINVKNKRDIERQLFQIRENYMRLDKMVATNFNTTVGKDWCECTNYCIWMKT